MPWKLDSDKPVYIQLVEHIKQDILSGIYKAGDKVPPVRELAKEAGVNPNTMQRVFQELERQGLMYSNRTAGRFITEDVNLVKELGLEQAMNETKQYYDSMHCLGYEKKQMFSMLDEYESKMLSNKKE